MNTLSKKVVATTFDVSRVRQDFPALDQDVNGYSLVYFDNGATSQKPLSVIQAISAFYTGYNANIHRGVHHLSQLATNAYEEARQAVADWINAPKATEVIFTSGTTAGINLVAQSWGRHYLKPGDEIVLSAMEHHGNIVPWQMVCQEKGAKLRIIPMNDQGELILEEAEKIIGSRTRMLALSHVSNALGTINPVAEIIAMARKQGALVLLDGAQAVPHFRIDVQQLDCDFYAFSAHKMLGSTGTGVLWAKEQLLNELPPWQGGGDMIESVSFEKTTYNVAPFRFEAGTPHIAGALALHAAINYYRALNQHELEAHEASLLQYASQCLLSIPGLRIIGNARHKVPVISFVLEGLHPYDVGFILDKYGIAVRTGHHCAQPVMDFFKIPGTIRASLAFYNTTAEIERLKEVLLIAKRMLS
ncbi:MAG: cysteine desulfurase [Bacteroidia bacterium]|nr:cysteine desulfurase [Bacteroidia bacterium]